MKNLSFFLLFLLGFSGLHAQTVFGKWKTMDDNTGEPRAIVNIYEKNKKVYGDIVRILDASDREKRCVKCPGKQKDVKIEGLTILKGLKKSGNQFEGGTILDPDCGKTYQAKIWLNRDNSNILNVRGYIGLLYRTQNWVRVNETNP